MEPSEILWLLLVPLGLVILAFMGLIVWSQVTDQPLSDVYRTLSDPDGEAERKTKRIEAGSNPTMKDNGFNNDPVSAQLDNDAHRAALQTWCGTQDGWEYDGDRNMCLASNQSACEARSSVINLKDISTLDPNNPFLEFVNGRCLGSLGLGGMCNMWQIPYESANVTCDDNGVCTAPNQPNCRITQQYCSSKGASFDSAGLGDCYVPFGQEVVEAIFGKTVTRKYRQNITNLVDRCRDDGPVSTQCIAAIGQFLATPGFIIYDSTVKGYQQDVTSFKNECTNGAVAGPFTADKCVRSTFAFFPNFWIAQKFSVMLNGMMMLLPKGFPIIPPEAFQAILDINSSVIDACFKFGPTAGLAAYQAGQEGVKAMNALFDGNLTEFTSDAIEMIRLEAKVVQNVLLALDPMERIGEICAKAILRSKTVQQALAIGKTIGLAVIHGAVSMGTFIAHTVAFGTIEAIRDIGDKIGEAFGDAGIAFNQAMQQVDKAFEDIGKSIGNSIEEGAKKAARGFCKAFHC